MRLLLRRWKKVVLNFLRSLYPATWAPFWVCAATKWYWFSDERYCKCCLYAATRYRTDGVTLSQLEYAAGAGCLRCAVIFKGISEISHTWRDGNIVKEVGILFRKPEISIRLAFTREGHWIDNTENRWFSFFIQEDAYGIVPDILLRKGIAHETESASCFDTIKSWTKECDLKHTACKTRAQTAKLPTRLIDVHGVRIVLGAAIPDKNIRYTALSHCWGSRLERLQPIPKLRKADVKDRSKGIPWTELTKTFQDAILISRRLGIDYIWIDSLCIVQDDAKDWATESSRMASVYGDAYVVIAATRSRTGDVGIFHSRTPAHNVLYDEVPGGSFTIRPRTRHEGFFTLVDQSFKQEPLFTRGWCFQERLLGKRILHFTEHEAVWECNEELWCECHGIGPEAEERKEKNFARAVKNKYGALLQRQGMNEEDGEGSHGGDGGDDDSCWPDVIQAYTARKLTYESDRLPALSGVAQQIASGRKGRYLAGMWERELPDALLWDVSAQNFHCQVQRDPDIPSWAWASVGAEIMPFGCLNPAETVASVLDVDCFPKTSDLFGQVSGGYVVLEAPLLEVELLHDEEMEDMYSLVCSGRTHNCGHDDDDEQREMQEKKRAEEEEENRWFFFPDTSSPKYLPSSGSTVTCVGIQLDSSEHTGNGFFCLIVRPWKTPGEFFRLGKASCPSHWFDKAKRGTIKIV